ncbi:thyroid adenoma-associated protein homolog [Odontomachus brunneus]|uniref:thyroid adenoma-associated protein homolog n=1 Tax=Odontomachus brunneus TaxID=486640 RepID=UPI0013F2888F|nr:thyroid adenoma-associated protein homolog [Odontomachus brunneus]
MEELLNENVSLNLCLSKLRKLKQNGTLDLDKYFTQQTIKWRNILEYSVLEAYVEHYNEEYRLDTLALLVESKKSTLRFTYKELNIILLFLRCNLCEKMEYIPLIKKALKRLKDSLAVMQRQLIQRERIRNHDKENAAFETYTDTLSVSDQISEQIEYNIMDYTVFFINLREICVDNLYPDATYHRRRSSLRILLLVQELLSNEFKDIEWSKEQVEKIFQCLLLDTYEHNKEMAYQLIKHTDPNLLCLDSKWQVEMIIKVAFQLGTSIRPIDSVTAAYMFKISMLSSVIKDVLNDIILASEENILDYKVDDNIAEATKLQLILLLYGRLKKALVSSKLNIGLTIITCSLYGYLFCMRSLLNDCNLRNAEKDKLWKDVIADIITLCIQLNKTVSVVVNNASPEGHLPMDLKTLNVSFPGNERVTPQMVLLCSWRTVKEVSHLFGLFATKATIQTNIFKSELLSMQQIGEMMEHLASLLCDTKHRGAFEQAYVGFHQLCTQLWQSTSVDLKLLPMWCLHDILIGITGLIPGYLICATRRSAGVPFLIQGLVSSTLKTGENSNRIFYSIMKILLQFTKLEDTVNLWAKVTDIMYEDFILPNIINIFFPNKKIMKPEIESRSEAFEAKVKLDITEIKIHSMNILRALFRHSQLSDTVKRYVADGLIVAFKHYDGRTWAERNAATLLFSALIVRIFGVQRTKDHINLTTCNMMTGRLFFERYPSLLPFILDELRTFISTNDTTIKSDVQAILLLLSRLYISNETDVTQKIKELRDLVSQCAKSPVYQTRELAARALIPLLTESTAHSTLTNLFQLILKITQDIQVLRTSANLIHGYLLQILKILKKFPSVKELFKPHQVVNLSSILQCILSCLNRRSDGFNSFPLATVYVDILRELYKTEKNIIDDCKMKDILHTLQQCLIEEDLSKPRQPWPGEQMYKVSVIKLVLHVGKYLDFLQTVHNGRNKAFEIWSRLLVTPEAEVQSIAWNTVPEVLTIVQDSEQRKLLGNYAILIISWNAALFTKNLHQYNPVLQDALFDFLYNCLMNANEWFVADADHKKHEICTLVLRRIYSHKASNVYFQRVNYLRLLGKCMTTLIHDITDKELEKEYKKDIYRKVCESNWISSLCKDFRPSVFDILFDLFDADNINAEQCHPVLDWWTMTLQLLVDDNADVRSEACKLICRIEPSNEVKCIERMLPVFFNMFLNTVADKCPEIAFSALFCWSVSLLDTDYEMDETDVFNKCRNYDVFEPVKISEICYNWTKSIGLRHFNDNILPLDVIEWINYRLETEFTALSFKEIVFCYKGNMPKIEKNLFKILDPTYKDKLLQVLVYEKYWTLFGTLNLI